MYSKKDIQTAASTYRSYPSQCRTEGTKQYAADNYMTQLSQSYNISSDIFSHSVGCGLSYNFVRLVQTEEQRAIQC